MTNNQYRIYSMVHTAAFARRSLAAFGHVIGDVIIEHAGKILAGINARRREKAKKRRMPNEADP